MSDPILIRPFAPGDEEAFRDINLEWIRRYFIVEAKDRRVLDRPQETILDTGGAILMAVEGVEAVGCVALIVMEDGTLELAKMGVRPKVQGRGLGRRLIAAALDEARAIGARRIYLETSSLLKVARGLYADAGFTSLVDAPPSPYARADVHMELMLEGRDRPGPTVVG
ncbi:MAG: GNAT family N-acetyltransferase [Alphaproteobacteria bacterium]|nr:GNAT family N-acetyltransferase [Alphaproteobacteria bacterium]